MPASHYDYSKEDVQDGQWNVEGFKYDYWYQVSGTRRRHKQQCIDLAQEWNRNMHPDVRAFMHGHNYRVRKVKP